MKDCSGLATIVSRRSPTDSPKLGSKSQMLSSKSTAVPSDDGAVVRVKAQVMTRSDEGWVAVDGGGLSFVGVYRRCVHVPIAPAPASQSQTRSSKDKQSDCTLRREKSHKELSDEDSTIECSVADDHKDKNKDKHADGTREVMCYEFTEFCIRAQRIADSRVLLSYVMNKNLAYDKPQPLFHHWRCVCETCKCGTTAIASATVTSQQRSILSNQSSINSFVSSVPVRRSNCYTTMYTSKHQLAKNDSVDSYSVTGSNALQQTAMVALPHNHGSFGLTFESSTDARAFYSAVRSALDKLESEMNFDAVTINIYPVSTSHGDASNVTSLPPTYPTKISQASTFSSGTAVWSKPSPTCDSQTTATCHLSTGLSRKQSSPNVLDTSPSCSEHPPLVKTYSDPPACTYTLPAASSGNSGPAKQQHETFDSESHNTSADDYSCLWDPTARVLHHATQNVAVAPVRCTQPTATAAAASRRFANGVSSFEFDTIMPSDINPNTADSEHIRSTLYSTSTCDDSTRRFRGSPPVEADLSYSRLTDYDIGLSAGTKRSSSLSRLNHFGVLNTAASETTRPSPSKRGTLFTRAHGTAIQNCYLLDCSSQPHLAANQTQLLASGACSRSSPSNTQACINGAGGVNTGTGNGTGKTESGSPRFLNKLFRSKKRGSRCDTTSNSSMSGMSQTLRNNWQTQAQAPHRSSKKSASRRSTTARPTLTRARCLHCQHEYFIERNQRGACSEAPAKAQSCGRSNRYFGVVDSCMHSMLESDNSDTEFEEERLRSSHSHSSARSSGAHDQEDSGFSTYSTSASHNRRQHACSHPDDYDVYGDEHESHSHCCGAPHCRRRRRWARRLLVGLLSIVAPCVWCYWVLVCYSCAATSCCSRCVGARHEPMPMAVDPNAPDHKS